MTLTSVLLVLVLGAVAKPKILEEHFDQLPRGAAPRGWLPLSLDQGPLGIWGAGPVKKPGSWPQALIQDGRPSPARWVGLALPGSYASFSARVLVGGGADGSGSAGLAVLDREGRPTIFAARAGGRGLVRFGKDARNRWVSELVPSANPLEGPWLIYLTLAPDGSVKAAWGSVAKVWLRMEARAGSGPWHLALAARTEGPWWVDDLRVQGSPAEAGVREAAPQGRGEESLKPR